ncbi:MAG TPA: hypothetical protein VI461_11620, partial [Chitinophagaceae bacterium]|nr:hypothetical protein [Chitinophagaceae bacterium]
MKKIFINISVKWLFAAGILVLTVIACQKHYDPNFTLPHQFKPGDINITTEQTKAILTWNASLFSSASTSYTVQVSQDSSFATNVVYDKVANSTTATVTDTVLAVRQSYYARVKANSSGTTAESGWVRSNPFSITGEQIFLALTASDIVDNAVLLKWITTPGLVRIVITPLPSGTPITINLTPADLAAEKKIIDGLAASTNYSAEIFDAVKSKGYLTFTTAAPLSGNLIDLRGIIGRPAVLTDTLPLIADASTIILKRGETYTVAAALSLSKSVKIISGPDLSNPNQAIISLPSNFNIVAGSTIGYIDFQDVSLIATDYTSKYIFNINAACTITRIGFENCRIEKMRGVVRLQTAVINLTNYVINNCIIDSIANYGVITIDNANCKAENISI